MSSKIIRGASAAGFGLAFAPSLESECQLDSPTVEHSTEPNHASVSAGEEVESLIAEAYERGHRDGRLRAEAENAAAAAALSQQVARTAAHLAGERPRLRRDAEADVVRLALSIAKRVLHRELSSDPQAIQGLVHVAIERMNSRDIVRVRMHPSHRESVRQVLESSQSTAQIEVSADPGLSVGDLIFETPQGELDASVESQMKEIELGIADRLGR